MKKVVPLGLLAALVAFSTPPSPKEDYASYDALMDLGEAAMTVSTPEEAAEYAEKNFTYILDQDLYGQSDYIASAANTIKRGAGDCEDIAIAIAGLLVDDGYPPLIVRLSRTYPEKRYNHSVYVYQDKETGLWGSLGTKEDCKPATHKSLDDLVSSFYYTHYKLVNLDAVSPDWKTKDLGQGKKTIYQGSLRRVE